MAETVNDNRKKRIKATLYRLKRKNHWLRDQLHRYRMWLGGLAVTGVLLSLTTAFFVADKVQPDLVLLGEGPAGVAGMAPEISGREAGSGEASYYGDELAGRATASGETFVPGGLTAAHRTLPMGSRLRVTNVTNGRSVVVRVNDRGPFVQRRVIDVSEDAARRLGMLGAGTAMVRLELLD